MAEPVARCTIIHSVKTVPGESEKRGLSSLMRARFFHPKIRAYIVQHRGKNPFSVRALLTAALNSETIFEQANLDCAIVLQYKPIPPGCVRVLMARWSPIVNRIIYSAPQCNGLKVLAGFLPCVFRQPIVQKSRGEDPPLFIVFAAASAAEAQPSPRSKNAMEKNPNCRNRII